MPNYIDPNKLKAQFWLTTNTNVFHQINLCLACQTEITPFSSREYVFTSPATGERPGRGTSRMQVAMTTTYPVMCPIPLCVASRDHNTTNVTDRRTDRRHAFSTRATCRAIRRHVVRKRPSVDPAGCQCELTYLMSVFSKWDEHSIVSSSETTVS